MSTRPEVMCRPRSGVALHLAAALALLAGPILLASPSAFAGNPLSSAASANRGGSGAKVNINTATLKDLEVLPGVGTVIAQRIMAGRPYKSVQELRRAGIPPNTVRGLLGIVTTGYAPAAAGGEVPRASAAPAPAARAAATPAADRRAPTALKSPAERTFFGIPIHFPWWPAPKPEPARVARGGEPEHAARAPRAEGAEPVRVAEPPADGMVWVDPDLKAYYHRGDRRYGTTRHGRYVWEDQAVRAGYRAPNAPKAPPRR